MKPRIIVITGAHPRKVQLATLDLMGVYANYWRVKFDDEIKDFDQIPTEYKVVVIDEIPNNSLLTVVNNVRRYFKTDKADFILVTAGALNAESIKILQTLEVEVRLIDTIIKPGDRYDFKIRVPKEFLHVPAAINDFSFEMEVRGKTADGVRFGISEILAPWSALQYVNFNAPGLEDYLVKALNHGATGE